jgi:hypothetical protein
MNRRALALAACTLTATVTAPTAATVAAPAWKPAAFEGFDHVQPHRYTTICPATIAGCLGPYFHAVSGTVTDGHGQQRSPGNAWASRGVLHVVARPAEPGDGPEPYTGADVVENGDGHGTLAWDVRARYVPDPAGVTWFNVLLWRGPHARCWPVGGETNFAESQGGRWLKYFVHAARYQDPVMSCGVQNSIAWRDPVRWPAASAAAWSTRPRGTCTAPSGGQTAASRPSCSRSTAVRRSGCGTRGSRWTGRSCRSRWTCRRAPGRTGCRRSRSTGRACGCRDDQHG